MRYTPITEEAANESSTRFKPLADGDYPFQVLEASEKTSKAGNPYIKLKLGVAAGPNREQWVWANLVPAMEFQLRHFCESTGLLAKYASGNLSASDCMGRTGIVRLKTEHQEGYDPRNVPDDYIVKLRDVAAPVSAVQEPATVAEDDVPF